MDMENDETMPVLPPPEEDDPMEWGGMNLDLI